MVVTEPELRPHLDADRHPDLDAHLHADAHIDAHAHPDTDRDRRDFGDRDRSDRDRGHRGRGPRGYRRSNERITEDVHDRLTDDPWIDASNIQVKVENGEVAFEQSFEVRESLIPASDYGKVRAFFENVAAAQGSPVVLVRK